MEEINSLDELMKGVTFPAVTYVAVFDPNSGKVLSVGPSYSFLNETHKIDIDNEIAESIIAGYTRLDRCFVDMSGNTLEIAEIKSAFKIDDVLHRVIDTNWADIEKPDIYITYSKNSLKFELSEELGGTRKAASPTTVKNRKVLWDGDTVMTFLITDYNDPNVIFKMLKIQLLELKGKSRTFKNIDAPSDKFSIYTRRIFKNYVLEIK